MIFRAVDADVDDDPSSNTYLGKNGVAWVLRFGGLCTLVNWSSAITDTITEVVTQIGACIARMVPPTQTEKQIRRILGEMEDTS